MTDAQAATVIGLLTEIRDALLLTDEPARAYDDSGRCLHPDEQRVSLGRDEWVCRRCRFQFSGVEDSGRHVAHG